MVVEAKTIWLFNKWGGCQQQMWLEPAKNGELF